MAKEIARGTVEPYASGPEGDELLPYSPVTPQSFDVPDYVVLRPPDTGKVQAEWAKIMVPFRFMALAFLWITYFWWRFAIMIALVVMVVVLLKMS